MKCLPSSIMKLSTLRLPILPSCFMLETLPYQLDESLVISVEDTHVRKTWEELKKEMEIFSFPTVRDYSFDGRDNNPIYKNSHQTMYHSRIQEVEILSSVFLLDIFLDEIYFTEYSPDFRETIHTRGSSQHDLQNVQMPENMTCVNEEVLKDTEDHNIAEQQTSFRQLLNLLDALPAFNSSGRNDLIGEKSHHAISHSQNQVMEHLSSRVCDEMISDLGSNFHNTVSSGKNGQHAVQDGQMNIRNSGTEHAVTFLNQDISSCDERDVSHSVNNLNALENDQIENNSENEGKKGKRKTNEITLEEIQSQFGRRQKDVAIALVGKKNELGETVSYTLHDLVYDLARSVAMHERLFLEASKKENKAVNIQHTEMTLDFPDKEVLENVRSLDMFKGLPRGLLMHVEYLRVLCIEHTNIEVLPESIANLKCLKYLALQGNRIKVLPECVMELYNLQSLCLYGCEPLSELPKRLSNLVNLRHLGLSFYLCLAEEGVIKQLSQLQTLPPLELSEEGFLISELGDLYHVNGTLDIKGLEVIKSKLDAQKSKLSMKSRVEQFRLSWANDANNIKHEVLDGLHPNPNLKLLSLKGYGGEKFPSWLMRMNVPVNCNNGYACTLCNLTKIELIDCGRCQQLPAMGHLPLLNG